MEKRIQQAGIFDHRFYSRAILTNTKPEEKAAIIPRASFDRYVKKLKTLSTPLVGQKQIGTVFSTLGGEEFSNSKSDFLTFDLGFTPKLRDFTTFQVFLICWVAVLSRDQRLSLDSLAARLKDGEHNRIYEALNDAKGRERYQHFYSLFEAVLESAQAKEKSKAVITTLG